jgi:hypothetical protein
MRLSTGVTWRRRVFDAPGLTQVPPGPYLDRLACRSIGSIRVSTPRYDDIGQVLTSMGVSFESFAGSYDCDLLFINCGTSDYFDLRSLHSFVMEGGCLYASDLTSGLIQDVFPGILRFAGSGSPGRVEAQVTDAELREVAGDRVTIHFDMPDWTLLEGCEGETLVQAAPGTAYAGRPLMVGVELGRGALFYTSFHNRAQASEQEKVLLQLLVLKQIGASSHTTLAQASKSVGVSLSALRMQADK